MTRNRRQFTREFKLQVIREVEVGKTLAQAAREHALHPNLIRKWQTQYAEYGQQAQAFAGNGRAYSDEAKIAELERLIGHLTIENDFVKRLLARLEAKHAARK
jgi:transposase